MRGYFGFILGVAMLVNSDAEAMQFGGKLPSPRSNVGFKTAKYIQYT